MSVTDQQTGGMRDVADVLRDIGAATKNLPTSQKLGFFKQIFGMYAIAGGAAMTTANFDKLIEAVDNAAGAGRLAAKEMDAGIGGSLRMMWSAVEGVAIAVGEALAPSLQKLTDWFTAATSGMVDYLTKNKQIVVQAAKIISAITGIGIGLFALGATFVGVGKTIGLVATMIASVAKIGLVGFGILSGAVSAVTMTVGTVVSAFSGVAGMIGMVFGGVATAVGTALSVLAAIGTTVFGAIGTVIAAAFSPLGLVILSLGAVAGACFLVYRNASAIGNIFSKVFSQIPRIASTAFSGAVGVVKTVVSGIGNVFSGIATFASNIFNGLVSVFSTVFNTLGSIVSGFGNFFLGAFTNVGVAVDWLREQFGNLLSFASQTVGAIAAALGRGDIEAAIGVVWATIKLIWTQGTTSLVSTWHWLVETMQTTWATCVFKISELLTTAWYGVQEFWTETVYTMSTLWTEFSSNVVSAWKTAEQAIAQGIGWIIAKMEGLDPNEMAATINEDYNRQSQQREAQKSQALTGIQKNHDEKMSSLKSEKDGTLDILKSDFEKSAGTRDAAYQAKLAAQQKELDAAKAAYDEAINRARNPQQTPQAEQSQSLAERLQTKVQEAIKGFSANTDLGSKVSVSGSFSAAAIASMGASSVMDRVAKATEKSEKHLQKMADKADTDAADTEIPDEPDEGGAAGEETAMSKELKQQTKYLRDIARGGLAFT